MPETIPEFEENGLKGRFIPEQWSPVLYRLAKEKTVFEQLFPPPPPLTRWQRLRNRWRYRFGVLRDAWNMICENW